MPLIVRESVDADAPSIALVACKAFEPLRRIYRPAPRPLPLPTDDPQKGMGQLVAVENGTVVAVVRYRLRDERLHLIGLAVHPDFQRRGIARRIVEHLASHAARRGIKELSLFTVEQTGNVLIFEKLGFAVLRRTVPQDLESAMGAPLSEAFMIRSIATPLAPSAAD